MGGGFLTGLVGPMVDPRQVELVKKVTEKTQQGKIVWNKSATGITASVSGKMQLSFVLSPPSFILSVGSLGWSVFAIRGDKGNEILRVENTSDVSVLLGGKMPSNPLTEAVERLYNLVQGVSKGEIEKAIDLVSSV